MREQNAINECTCPEVYFGPNPSGSKNWNPDCPEHGEDSVWYRTEGQEHYRKQSERAVEMQRLAREARRKAREGE